LALKSDAISTWGESAWILHKDRIEEKLMQASASGGGGGGSGGGSGMASMSPRRRGSVGTGDCEHELILKVSLQPGDHATSRSKVHAVTTWKSRFTLRGIVHQPVSETFALAFDIIYGGDAAGDPSVTHRAFGRALTHPAVAHGSACVLGFSMFRQIFACYTRTFCTFSCHVAMPHCCREL
jgi:hypothetical protein